MNNQPDTRFPKAASISLAFLFILIAVLAGYGETHATPVEGPAPPSQPNAAAELVWVRQDAPIINVNNDPTYWEATEPRFVGSYGEYTLSETEITYHERWVDHGDEWYDVTLKTVFDRPPLVLNPPLRYQVKATASHSGTHNYGSIGMASWYSSPYGAVIEPNEVLSYYPYIDTEPVISSKEWMINPPAILGEGDSFEITFGWWNCYPCNVTWTYKAEPANAVPRLGVEVLQPIVTYQGEEVPPGETYFPEDCPITTLNTADSCADKQELTENAQIKLNCTAGGSIRGLLLLEMLGLVEEVRYKLAVIKILGREMAERCGYLNSYQPDEADAYQLDLALDEGAIQLSNVVSGLTTSVDTPLGAAYTASKGTFLTAYNPDTNSALFRAYSTPLLLEPKSGSTLVIKPNQEVELTSEGFGPVSELPHLYLPMVTR